MQWRDENKRTSKSEQLCLIFPDWFFSSMKWYLQLRQAAQTVQLLQDIISKCVVTRFVVSPSRVSKAQRSYKETSHYLTGTGEALPEPYKKTSSKLLLSIFLRAQRPLLGSVLAVQDHAAQFGTCQRTPGLDCLPLLFTNKSKFMLSTCDRCEKVCRPHDEYFAACNIIQPNWFGGGTVMVHPWRDTQSSMP